MVFPLKERVFSPLNTADGGAIKRKLDVQKKKVVLHVKVALPDVQILKRAQWYKADAQNGGRHPSQLRGGTRSPF